MSPTMSTISEAVPPPPTLIQDEPDSVEAARQRLAPPSRLARILSFPKLRSRSKSSLTKHPKETTDITSEARPSNNNQDILANPATALPLDYAPITLNDAAIKEEDDDETRDKYDWAVVYENQRGMTIFSIPYYSALSLLPTDPSAFTLPNTSQKRSQQPPITLETYPLPDGNWRWVSRAWMIDMRSGSTIQHDGFEYNWMFRRHNWRAETGFLSAGGWVRRRRWVRLMMRPSKTKVHSDFGSASSSASSTRNLLRQSMASSNLTSASSLLHATVETVWQGNEDDWKRCRSLMLRYARDGRKIDLWKIWLGYYHPAHEHLFTELSNPVKGKQRQKQWTEDDGPLSSQCLEPDAASHRSMTPPPREYIAPVLRKRGHDLLQLLVFPDSRAQLLKLLGKAGFLPDIGVSIGSNFSISEVQFWSYMNGLTEEFKQLDLTNSPISDIGASSLPPET